MNIFGAVHDATVELGDNSKTSKSRLIARIGRLKRALDDGMPEPKRTNLKRELRGLLVEIDAREEAVNEIMATFE